MLSFVSRFVGMMIDNLFSQCRAVVHAVGPYFTAEGQAQEEEILSSAYLESLKLASSVGARSVAFPALSCGVRKCPHEVGSKIGLGVAKEFLLSALQEST